MPGVNIGYYADQINPDVYEPDKERMIGIKHLLDTGQIDNRRAGELKKQLVDSVAPHEERLRNNRKYREAWRTEAKIANEAQDERLREISQAQFKARKEIEKLSGELSAGIVPE